MANMFAQVSILRKFSLVLLRHWGYDPLPTSTLNSDLFVYRDVWGAKHQASRNRLAFVLNNPENASVL